jgi:uncharacterized protein (DUF58 family)
MMPHGLFDHARRLAAALCYIGLAHLDRVSLLPFADTLGTDVSTGRAKHTIVRVLDALERLEADGRTSLEQSVLAFGRRSPVRGLAIVLSDFLDPGADRALGLLAAMGHEVFAIHLTTSREVDDPTLAGDWSLEDAETGERRTIELTPGLLAEYRRIRDAHARELAAACARLQAGCVRVDADEPFAQVLLHTLRAGRLLE